MRYSCVILAAGLGKRMNSSLPKVLHRLYDVPMLKFVIDAGRKLRPERIIVVVGKNHGLVKDSIGLSSDISFAIQEKSLGTANALLSGTSLLKDFKGVVVILNGDMPLITPETIRGFLKLHERHKNILSVASFIVQPPHSYGRIIRDSAKEALRIVETSSLNETEKAINEVNSGLYAIDSTALPLLRKIKLQRTKKEYYLTDILGIVRKAGLKTSVYCMADGDEFIGINTRQELLKAHDILRKRQVKFYAKRGVNFIDAELVFIHPYAVVGKGTLIYPNVHIQGKSKVGRGCIIYPNVRIIDSIIKDRVVIKDSTLIEESFIGSDAQVGPFAHIRTGSSIGASAKIGNFVEVKKSFIGTGTKAMHLSYIGDATVGRGVNIGAGTITCNYDGKKKYKTIIEDGVFVGSDSQLVAPVRLKKGSYVGAGSTITDDVPANALGISRVRQRNIKGWAKRKIRINEE